MPYEYTIKLPDQELVVKVANATFTPANHQSSPPDNQPATPGHVLGAEARLVGVEIVTGSLAAGDLEVASVTIIEGGNPVFEAHDSTVRYGTDGDGPTLYIRERDRP